MGTSPKKFEKGQLVIATLAFGLYDRLGGQSDQKKVKQVVEGSILKIDGEFPGAEGQVYWVVSMKSRDAEEVGPFGTRPRGVARTDWIKLAPGFPSQPVLRIPSQRPSRAIPENWADQSQPCNVIHHAARFSVRGEEKYSSERFDPNLNQCDRLSLDFDGASLVMRNGSAAHSYHARSGRADATGAFNYSDVAQTRKSIGPIPAGAYWINPGELWTNAWWRLAAPTSAWGNFRVTLHPFTTTITYGRGGFFIHGGDVPGSAGRIDLWSDMDRFVADLKAELKGMSACQIHVSVKYPKGK